MILHDSAATPLGVSVIQDKNHIRHTAQQKLLNIYCLSIGIQYILIVTKLTVDRNLQ